MRNAAARQRARHELVGDFLTDIAHLLAADWMGLGARNFFGAVLRLLTNDGGRQQLLFHAQCQQPVTVLVVEVLILFKRTGPAAAFHLETTARLQGLFGELALEVFASHRPFCGQPVDTQILNPHGRKKRWIIRAAGGLEQRLPAP